MSDAVSIEVAERNRLRESAGLPLLDVVTEINQAIALKNHQEFEAAFAAQRNNFATQWTGNGDGFFANCGRYIAARRALREKLLK
jgi:hypothetical protein